MTQAARQAAQAKRSDMLARRLMLFSDPVVNPEGVLRAVISRITSSRNLEGS
jgi:hypothetical protein